MKVITAQHTENMYIDRQRRLMIKRRDTELTEEDIKRAQVDLKRRPK